MYVCMYIPPHIKCVASLPCEILVSEKNRNNLKDVVGYMITTSSKNFLDAVMITNWGPTPQPIIVGPYSS